MGDPNGEVACYAVNKKLGLEELWRLRLSKGPVRRPPPPLPPLPTSPALLHFLSPSPLRINSRPHSLPLLSPRLAYVPPLPSPPLPAQIASLALGGLKALKDQVFAASGNTLWGVKKVGKEFFRFQTPLSEPISTLAVNSLRLHITTPHAYAVFAQTDSVSHYTVGSRGTPASPKLCMASPLTLLSRLISSLLPRRPRIPLSVETSST